MQLFLVSFDGWAHVITWANSRETAKSNARRHLPVYEAKSCTVTPLTNQGDSVRLDVGLTGY